MNSLQLEIWSPFVIPATALVLLVFLSASDLIRRRLPNALLIALLGLFFLKVLIEGWPMTRIGFHAGIGGATFVVLAGLYACGWLGGGDVKMMAVIATWAGPDLALAVLLVISVSGAVLAVIGIVIRCLVVRLWGEVPGNPEMPRSGVRSAGVLPGVLPKVLGWFSAERGVPYGVAISMGGALAVLAQLTG